MHGGGRGWRQGGGVGMEARQGTRVGSEGERKGYARGGARMGGRNETRVGRGSRKGGKEAGGTEGE